MAFHKPVDDVIMTYIHISIDIDINIYLYIFNSRSFCSSNLEYNVNFIHLFLQTFLMHFITKDGFFFFQPDVTFNCVTSHQHCTV